MSIDRVIAENAPRQHALITLEQLRVAGITDDQVESRLSSGRLLRIRPRVYTVPGAPPTFEQAVLAAALTVGSDAVASHASAAALWGLPFAEQDALELTTSRSHWVRLAGVRSHRTIAFLRCEHTVRKHIPITTVARTLVDLSSRLSVSQLGRMTDDALRQGTLRLEDLRRCVAGLAPARGRRPKRIEAVLTRRLPGYEPGDSALEMRFVRGLLAAGLPELVQQYRVRIGARRYRIDLAYPDEKLAIELDGWETHRMRSAFDEDRARANDLVVAGWHVLRFTSSMTDEQAVSTVRSALAALAQRPVA
jgi:very-short-patch-repair endonuclease